MTAPITIPCRDGSTYTITPDVIDAYRRLYADVDGELAKMVIKLEGRKAMRPASPGSAPRFVRNWFAKARKLPPPPMSPDFRTARSHSISSLTGGMSEGVHYE